MRVILLSLLFANILLFMYLSGSLGKITEAGHEPQRLDQQINPDAIIRVP